jgi:hypothetical protein
VHVNLGGEPGKDDFGLPPIDIEIPDDARELDRDVQAYRREQRALRRRLRAGRLRAPLSRDGMMLPLLAGCLLLALISGTLLTVFAAGPTDVPAARGPARSHAARSPAARTRAGSSPAASSPAPRTTPGSTTPAAAAPARTAGTAVIPASGRLPDSAVAIGRRQVGLRTLTRSVLALVPLRCRCALAVRQLVAQAARARLPVYLVGTGSGLPQVQALARSGRPVPAVADDVRNVLGARYGRGGMTAILVGADGSVALAPMLKPGLQLESRFLRLAAGQAAGP